MRVASMMLVGALSRLLDEEGKPTFVTKGGIAIELRMREQARTTQDVDVILRGSLDALVDRLAEAFAKPYEGFAFRAGEPEVLEIRPQVRRVLIRVFFAGRSFNTRNICTLAQVQLGRWIRGSQNGAMAPKSSRGFSRALPGLPQRVRGRRIGRRSPRCRHSCDGRVVSAGRADELPAMTRR